MGDEREELLARFEATVAVDTFSTENKYSFFFLTHAHTDHMAGLPSFLSASTASCGMLYASELTLRLLAATPSLPPLPSSTTLLPDPGGEDTLSLSPSPRLHIVVQTFDAHHVPGSRMLLFQLLDPVTGATAHVLNTGDFRTSVPHPLLSGIELDVARVDTTFAQAAKTLHFPSRATSQSAIIQHANHLVDKEGVRHLGIIVGMLGTEDLVVDLVQALGTQVILDDPSLYERMVVIGIDASLLRKVDSIPSFLQSNPPLTTSAVSHVS